jgi:hypothetical protein
MVSLVVEISQGTCEVEPSVDPTHYHLSSSLSYSAHLSLGLRLVVFAESEGLASPAKDGSGIPCVGHKEVGGGDQDDIGGAAHSSSNEFLLELVCFLIVVSNDPKLVLSLWGFNQLIYILECFI